MLVFLEFIEWSLEETLWLEIDTIIRSHQFYSQHITDISLFRDSNLRYGSGGPQRKCCLDRRGLKIELSEMMDNI